MHKNIKIKDFSYELRQSLLVLRKKDHLSFWPIVSTQVILNNILYFCFLYMINCRKTEKSFFLINQELHICGLGKIFPKLANPKKERHVYSRGNLRCSESLKEAQKCPLWTLASYRRFLGDSRSHSLFGLLYVWPVFRTQPVAEKQACSSIEDNSTLLCLPRSRKRSMRGLILSTELVRDTIKSKKLE